MGVNIQFYKLELVKEKSARYEISKKVDSPESAVIAINNLFNLKNQAEEIFVMLVLNNKNKITGAFEVSRGTINTSLVHPREVFKRAILCNAASILVAHNHPSGDVTPSTEDNEITNKLKEAGKILGIKVLDHIIVGDEKYYSYKEDGMIF